MTSLGLSFFKSLILYYLPSPRIFRPSDGSDCILEVGEKNPKRLYEVAWAVQLFIYRHENVKLYFIRILKADFIFVKFHEKYPKYRRNVTSKKVCYHLYMNQVWFSDSGCLINAKCLTLSFLDHMFIRWLRAGLNFKQKFQRFMKWLNHKRRSQMDFINLNKYIESHLYILLNG